LSLSGDAELIIWDHHPNREDDIDMLAQPHNADVRITGACASLLIHRLIAKEKEAPEV